MWKENKFVLLAELSGVHSHTLLTPLFSPLITSHPRFNFFPLHKSFCSKPMSWDSDPYNLLPLHTSTWTACGPLTCLAQKRTPCKWYHSVTQVIQSHLVPSWFLLFHLHVWFLFQLIYYGLSSYLTHSSPAPCLPVPPNLIISPILLWLWKEPPNSFPWLQTQCVSIHLPHHYHLHSKLDMLHVSLLVSKLQVTPKAFCERVGTAHPVCIQGPSQYASNLNLKPSFSVSFVITNQYQCTHVYFPG